jgi:hypothetical protein
MAYLAATQPNSQPPPHQRRTAHSPYYSYGILLKHVFRADLAVVRECRGAARVRVVAVPVCGGFEETLLWGSQLEEIEVEGGGTNRVRMRV